MLSPLATERFEKAIDEHSNNDVRANHLPDFKLTANLSNLSEIDFPDMKIPQLAIFDFSSLLGLGMLLAKRQIALVDN